MNKTWQTPCPLLPLFPGLSEPSEISDWIQGIKRELTDQQVTLLRHVIGFVYRKGARSEYTYRGLRNETERFLLYLFAHDLEPSSFRPGDVGRYLKFCQAPPVKWVMTEHFHRYRPDGEPEPRWRPFYCKDVDPRQQNVSRSTISQSSLQRQFSFLNQLFKDLLDYDLVAKNPVPVAKRDSPYLINDTDDTVVKHFTKSEWVKILKTLVSLADADPGWERALFVILLMKTCYLRVADLADRPYYSPTMGDFYRFRGYLFLKVMSKRKKSRSVSVPEALEPFIVRYRESRGLDGLPVEGERFALISKDKGYGNVGVRQLNRIVNDAFRAVAKEFEKSRNNVSLAAKIDQASTHWLRHTGASLDALWRPLPELAAELGHSDPGTTGRVYVNSSLEERAESGSGRAIA